MTLIERAVAKQSTDSQPRQNDVGMPGVPVVESCQGLREYEECIRALRERLVATGKIA